MPLYALSSRLFRTVSQTADVTEAASSSAIDIPGLSIVLPRPGTYWFEAVTPWTALDATSRTMGIGVAFSGSVTQLSAWPFWGTPGGVTAFGPLQSTAGTLTTRVSQTGTLNTWVFNGMIKVSTAGTLKMQFSRSAASITHLNGVLTVSEG